MNKKKTTQTIPPRSNKESNQTGQLQIQHIAIDQLRPWQGNPRLMPPEEARRLVRSIQEFGFVEPIVVRKADQMVIGGHQRLEAAKASGFTQVPVVYVDLSEVQAKALNLALNKIHGDWDLPLLGTLLEELRDLPEIDVSLSGFDEKEIDRLLADLERQSPLNTEEERFDAAEAMLQAEQTASPPRVQPGEVWQLGQHRLICADATQAASWQRLMGERKAQAVITDPPYAVHYIGGRAAQEERIAKARRGVGSAV